MQCRKERQIMVNFSKETSFPSASCIRTDTSREKPYLAISSSILSPRWRQAGHICIVQETRTRVFWCHQGPNCHRARLNTSKYSDMTLWSIVSSMSGSLRSTPILALSSPISGWPPSFLVCLMTPSNWPSTASSIASHARTAPNLFVFKAIETMRACGSHWPSKTHKCQSNSDSFYKACCSLLPANPCNLLSL